MLSTILGRDLQANCIRSARRARNSCEPRRAERFVQEIIAQENDDAGRIASKFSVSAHAFMIVSFVCANRTLTSAGQAKLNCVLGLIHIQGLGSSPRRTSGTIKQ